MIFTIYSLPSIVLVPQLTGDNILHKLDRREERLADGQWHTSTSLSAQCLMSYAADTSESYTGVDNQTCKV